MAFLATCCLHLADGPRREDTDDVLGAVMNAGARIRAQIGRMAQVVAPHAYAGLYDAFSSTEPGRCVELLRTAPLACLRNPTYVEHDLLPRLGVAGSLPSVFPSELKHVVGTGLQAMQWPIQLAPYLVRLSEYPIRSYLEIGAFLGGTFVTTVEYLNRFTPVEHAVAVDVTHGVAVRRYTRTRAGAEYVRAASGTRAFRRRVEVWDPDLVLIDADHSYQAVRNDFACVDGIARIIALHDIIDTASPGVQRFWGELRDQRSDDYAFVEFVDQYPEVVLRFGGATALGLGLAVRRDFFASSQAESVDPHRTTIHWRKCDSTHGD